MKLRLMAATCLLSLVVALCAACDTSTGSAPSPTAPAAVQEQSSPTQAPLAQVPTTEAEALDTPMALTAQAALPGSGTPIDAAEATQPPAPDGNNPSPTPVTATSTGPEMTALQALAALEPKALAWQPDARLGLLANTRPGQQKNLLSGALGNSDVNETTPGGKGRGWTLVAFSPSGQGAVAISTDGTQVDLIKAGAVTSDVVARFTGSDTEALDLSKIDPTKLVDSDKIAESAAARGARGDIGVALLSPSGLGLGPLPTPQAGGPSPEIAYEVLVDSAAQQSFIFFDAATGAVVLDSSAP